jgi:hypothetical protein
MLFDMADADVNGDGYIDFNGGLFHSNYKCKKKL